MTKKLSYCQPRTGTADDLAFYELMMAAFTVMETPTASDYLTELTVNDPAQLELVDQLVTRVVANWYPDAYMSDLGDYAGSDEQLRLLCLATDLGDLLTGAEEGEVTAADLDAASRIPVLVDLLAEFIVAHPSCSPVTRDRLVTIAQGLIAGDDTAVSVPDGYRDTPGFDWALRVLSAAS